MLDQGHRKITPYSFCKYLGAAAGPTAVSYLACVCLDPAFQESDFDNFKVEKWWRVAKAFFKKHGVEPHPATVAPWSGPFALSPALFLCR